MVICNLSHLFADLMMHITRLVDGSNSIQSGQFIGNGHWIRREREANSVRIRSSVKMRNLKLLQSDTATLFTESIININGKTHKNHTLTRYQMVHFTNIYALRFLLQILCFRINIHHLVHHLLGLVACAARAPQQNDHQIHHRQYHHHCRHPV